jgi:deoxyinosine 3'endonuclease (endonuclease V)
MLPPKLHAVAGVDVSYLGDIGVGAVAVLDYDTLQPLELQVTNLPSKNPIHSNFAFF